VWPLLKLVDTETEAHTAEVIKIISLQTTTIILPISREQHLLKVFASLEMLECDRERTSLLAFVDGDADLFRTARNLVEQSKFAERLCVHGNIPGERREFSINTRRRRISAIHNEIRKLIRPSDELLLLIEDDTILAADTLSKLMYDHLSYPHAGFITGVQYGRSGINHLGLWRTDDVYDPTKLESSMLGSGVDEVDAAGLMRASSAPTFTGGTNSNPTAMY
jgi:hypothetical protein